MNISYSCNDYYIPQTGISLISLFENNKDIDEITLFFVSKGVTEENKNIIKNICDKYGRELRIVEFDDIAPDLNLSDTGRHIETIYTKIFYSRIPELHKIIYLDSDTIISGSLRDLWETDLSDNYMGMVETYTGKNAKRLLNIPSSAPFFNDGFAIVNVDYCRENNLIEKCLKLISDFDGNPPVLSEGTLNKVCYGHILPISPRYNMMAGLYHLFKLNPQYISEKLNYSMEDLKDSFAHPIIIHYLSAFYDRPWNSGCKHPLKQYYEKYKLLSPWASLPPGKSSLSLKIRFLGFILNLIGPYNFDKLQKK